MERLRKRMSFIGDMNFEDFSSHLTPSKDEAVTSTFDGFTPLFRPFTRGVKLLGTPATENRTPTKDEAVDVSNDVATPTTTTNRVRPPVLVDEDSGLGMTPEHHKTSPLKTSNSDSQVISVTRARRSLFSLKRCSDGDVNGSLTKRYKEDTGRNFLEEHLAPKKALLFEDESSKPTESTRSSEIMTVVDRLAEDDLIGNGSKTFSLPTIPGKHSDLKSITSTTMSDILLGKYDDVINSYRIIDCRYPYEFDGGHIKDAENLYLREQVDKVLKEVSSAPSTSSSKNDILIFHCEFSSERGPKMLRFLRSQDREMNKDRYPFLHFPEVYLLHDGYKAFFENCKEHCEPMNYTPMLHSDHASDLRHFRKKSKSWCVGEKRRLTQQRLCF